MITFKSWVGQARCKGLPEPPAHTISVHSQGSGSAASSTPSALRWLEAGDSSRAWHPPHPLRSSVPRRCLPHPTPPTLGMQGGLAQLLAGQWEFKRQNTFGAAAFRWAFNLLQSLYATDRWSKLIQFLF